MLLKSLADLVERPAGEIAIGFALMLVGALFFIWKIPKSDDIIVAGFTLVSRAMIGNVSKRVSDAKAE